MGRHQRKENGCPGVSAKEAEDERGRQGETPGNRENKVGKSTGGGKERTLTSLSGIVFGSPSGNRHGHIDTQAESDELSGMGKS